LTAVLDTVSGVLFIIINIHTDMSGTLTTPSQTSMSLIDSDSVYMPYYTHMSPSMLCSKWVFE